MKSLKKKGEKKSSLRPSIFFFTLLFLISLLLPNLAVFVEPANATTGCERATANTNDCRYVMVISEKTDDGGYVGLNGIFYNLPSLSSGGNYYIRITTHVDGSSMADGEQVQQFDEVYVFISNDSSFPDTSYSSTLGSCQSLGGTISTLSDCYVGSGVRLSDIRLDIVNGSADLGQLPNISYNASNLGSASAAHIDLTNSTRNASIAVQTNTETGQTEVVTTQTTESGETTTETTAVTPTARTGNENSSPDCGSQAGSVGWVVCPTMELAANGTDGLYGALKGFLNLDPELLSGNLSSSPTYIMWQYFRNFANIILVIIMLFIILSQITGFGIDNYGIKKMLPRLIVAGILINLSYFIVQLAVDVSNILGNSLSTWLDAVGRSVAQAAGIEWAKVVTAGVLDLLAAVIALAGGAASAVIGPATVIMTSGVSVSFWILMIPLIISILIALVSVLIFFLLLGARKLVVMACAVLAPLAFVCYILPNTQNIFKKWVDVLKGMLIVYPTCSLLYGIAQLVKYLAYSSSNADIFMVMIAVIASFIPFLVAPSLIRKAFNSLGEVGARLQGFGRGLTMAGRRAQDGVRRSGMYQDAMRQSNLDMARKREEALSNIQKNGGTLTRRQQRQLVSSRATIQREAEREKAESDYLNEDKYDAIKANQAAKFEESDIKSYMDQIDAGTFVSMKADGSTEKVDSTDMDSLERALQVELSKAPAEQDAKRATAIRRKLETFGDKGYDRISNVIDSGTIQNGAATKRTIDDVAANGGIKTSARSLYNVAQGLQGSIRAGTFANDYKGGLVTASRTSGSTVGDMKYEQIPDMSDQQFTAFAAQKSSQAAGMAYEALSDDRVRGRLKSGQIDALTSQYANHVLNNLNGDEQRAKAYELLHNGSVSTHIDNQVPAGETESVKAKLENLSAGYVPPEQAQIAEVSAQLRDQNEANGEILKVHQANAAAQQAAAQAQVQAAEANRAAMENMTQQVAQTVAESMNNMQQSINTSQQAQAQAAAQRAHIERAAREGRNAGGTYNAPAGFKVDLSANANGRIWKNSSTGETYDAESNKFI